MSMGPSGSETAACDTLVIALDSFDEWIESNELNNVLILRRCEVPEVVADRWQPAAQELLDGDASSLAGLPIDHSVPVVDLRGGESAARKRLSHFVSTLLSGYADRRNRPDEDATSGLSPYLHFGHVSPLYLALAAKTAGNHLAAAREAYLEELIVRRELAINFVTFTLRYDAFACLPGWARKTLDQHAADRRHYSYGRQALEQGATHDPYWNAAMAEMRDTGFMHNYMRMYWGKKVLEWSPSPREAYETLLFLNNRYFIDGRDPNSFAGVGWVFGLHDRAWFQRDIFGKVRYMAASGLERKCDIQGYVEKVTALCRRADRPGGRSIP